MERIDRVTLASVESTGDFSDEVAPTGLSSNGNGNGNGLHKTIARSKGKAASGLVRSPARFEAETQRSAVRFDESTRTFSLCLSNAYYVVRVLDDGSVVHVGSGSLPAAAALAGVTHLDQYLEPDFVFSWDCTRYELPPYGDVATHDVALKVVFPEPTGGSKTSDEARTPVRDVRPRYVNHRIDFDSAPGLAAVHDRPARLAHRPRETLRIRMKDALYDFYVTLCYRLTPELDLIERWVELENNTKDRVTIETLAFATLHLAPAKYELTYVAGGWGREFTPLKQNLGIGKFTLEQRGLNTGHGTNPIFMLGGQDASTEEAGDVWFGALAYSGNWALRFETLPTGYVRVHGGYESGDFELRLAPGESHKTPAMILGISGQGRGGASRRLHQFARDYVLPSYTPAEAKQPESADLRPVLYNSWEATEFAVSYESQSKLARLAAEMGVELFVVDDGWFGGRRHDKAGLGDWWVSPAAFPNGLTPLIDEVRRLGMKFGLWFEPEMVNVDSDLYRAHPDWILHFPGRPRTEHRNQLILDFGRPEVVEHVHRTLDSMLQKHKIDFIKWDMNRAATEPGSVAGRAIWYKHVEGVYSIMDRLRSDHPNLDIQSCSGGGGRADFGVLQRADQVWTSDSTDAFDRLPIQEGFSLAYPQRVMEAWVTNTTNHLTNRSAPLGLRFDIAMRGVLGIGAPLDQLSAEERAEYKRKIAFYKRIRPVVQKGDLYRLVWNPPFSVWLTVLPDASAAVYSCVVASQHQGEFLPPVKLRGLDVNATYIVIDEFGSDIGRFSGVQLMTLGLPGDCHFGGNKGAIRSRTLLLKRLPRSDAVE